ncbi:signal peptide, CUB and EGF-like domain-containing protein 2 [Anoplophora glabripennis]|uniref:signal peptide, CUB and EGF-like domain-containing protein 2 n=1 Tax=Anoplophora glabripennis TaxID=217634 RepID=UPI000874505E|nr:signal peptide, CUB and EGF-like domain-containing protein 2 [Anoplophora glabripennis]
MFILAWILVFIQVRRTISGYIEIVQTSDCNSCRLMLTCKHLNSIIAILDVEFTPGHVNDTLGNTSVTPTLFPPVHPRGCLNQRCSGVNHCSFILEEDCPGSDLGPGTLFVKYACVTEDRIKKYCNSEIVLPSKFTTGISEGFIQNPGYPRFYSGQRECRWKITAPSQQRIRLTILDISVIVDNVSSEEECTDILQIKDTGQVIYSTCRQQNPPAKVISGSESIEVVLTSRDYFNPLRGFLMHYTAVGCPMPNLPQDGYLVYRTDELAIFSCCVGYYFPDTGKRTKSLRCLGAYWNISLPILDCQKASLLQSNQTQEIIIKSTKTRNMVTELLAPVLLIVVLFIINGGILFYILRARKRQTLDEMNDDELGPITSSN